MWVFLWHISLTGEVQRRYYSAAAELEQQYMNEIGELLADLTDASSEISRMNASLCERRPVLNAGFVIAG